MPKIANSSKLILILSTFILIGLLASSHQTRSFFHSKTKIELKNDSLSLLFDPKIAEQKSIKLDTFFKKLQQNTGFNGAVLISQYGKVIYNKSFGYANYFTKTLL